MNIGETPFAEFWAEAKAFHGYPGPGLIVGGFMAELAKTKLPKGLRYHAISETLHCLPDAIMLTTPCTVGNNRLKTLDLGRYALTLYNKEDGNGVRVHIDLEKLEKFPAISEWFMKRVPKKEQDQQKLNEELKSFGFDALVATKVVVSEEFLNRFPKSKTHLCPVCKESFPVIHGTTCRACAGQSPYSAL